MENTLQTEKQFHWLVEWLKVIRERFEDNYPKYPCTKYEEKRSLYIRLTSAKSKLSSLKNFLNSKDKGVKDLESITMELKLLESLESSLLVN